MEFLLEYGLFFAKTVTLGVVAFILVVFVISLTHKSRRSDQGHIEVYSLNERIKNITKTLKHVILDPDTLKKEIKAEEKLHKQEQKKLQKEQKQGIDDRERKQRVYVIDFEGDLGASSVKQLREEITAILSVAETPDEVVVRLESPGGMVHAYGLAASQLSRIVSKNLYLTVAVDKMAASGGYMMACIAKHLIAAPFAILGSIGVVAQIPNFNRLLKSKDIDYEILTAGEYKRTMSIFGENTEKGRTKFIEELEDVHQLFKDFVAENRPMVDTETVATGEAWYGKRALERNLVDALQTSDEYLFDKCQAADVYRVQYVENHSRVEKILDRMASALTRITHIANKSELTRVGPYTF